LRAYTRAIALDPGFAAAYAGLSFAETACHFHADTARFFLGAGRRGKGTRPWHRQLADAYRARAQLPPGDFGLPGARAE